MFCWLRIYAHWGNTRVILGLYWQNDNTTEATVSDLGFWV